MKRFSTLFALFAVVLFFTTQAGAQGYMGHPAFHLFDEDGNLIDPISGKNSSVPYSPKQTCGGSCHDYDLITGGFHFQQGWDEIDPDYGTPWVWSPGMMGKW